MIRFKKGVLTTLLNDIYTLSGTNHKIFYTHILPGIY